MIAVDTNILLRTFVADNPAQARIARRLMEHTGGVFVSKTVLVEVEWVLRSLYRQSPVQIHFGLSGLLGLPNVVAESPEQVFQAMEDFAAGMDFADALHVASSQADEGFYSFDRKLTKKANSLGRDAHLANTGVSI